MKEQQYWLSPQEIHNDYDAEVRYQDMDSWGRPMVDHCPNGTNFDRHLDNLSRFSGWYEGVYYHEGIAQQSYAE